MRVDNLDLLTTDAEDIVKAPGRAPHYHYVVHGADVARGRPLDHLDTWPDVTELNWSECSGRGPGPRKSLDPD